MYWVSYVYTYTSSLLSLPPQPYPSRVLCDKPEDQAEIPDYRQQLPPSYLFYTWQVHIN